MKKKTIWGNVKYEIRNNEDNESDILIIGAGITGLTLAYYFRNSKKKVMLIDKSKIGNGITSKTTAKISYLQQDIYQKLEKTFDSNTASLYYQSQKEAIKEIKKIVEENNIDCDFEQVNSILFTIDEQNKTKIEKEKELLQSWNVKTEDISNPHIISGFLVSDTYQFHPIKYMKGIVKIISKSVNIKDNICAYHIEKEKTQFKVNTNKGILYSNIVIVATHYPFFISPLFLPLKTYIKREYVNVAKIECQKEFQAINIDKQLHSIRFYQDYLIYGSNSHKLTNQIDYSKHYLKSKNDFKNIFHKDSEYTWINQDIMSQDHLPFIGELKPNLYIATAYNAWGMTNGTIASIVIYDLITTRKSSYQQLFSPKRMNYKLVTKSFGLIASYTKVYFESLFKKSNPSYIKIKGVIYGVYVDENNIEHRIKLVCPHMKCLLVFNKAEKTWDCPCHGSRFDLDGKLIVGPAKKNLKEENKRLSNN